MHLSSKEHNESKKGYVQKLQITTRKSKQKLMGANVNIIISHFILGTHFINTTVNNEIFCLREREIVVELAQYIVHTEAFLKPYSWSIVRKIDHLTCR